MNFVAGMLTGFIAGILITLWVMWRVVTTLVKTGRRIMEQQTGCRGETIDTIKVEHGRQD